MKRKNNPRQQKPAGNIPIEKRVAQYAFLFDYIISIV